jgi:hypothetical protein
MKMTARLMLWLYDLVRFMTKVASAALVASVLFLLLAQEPRLVVFLIEMVSPISDAIKDVLFGMFPDSVQKARKMAAVVGGVARWALTFTGAREEAIARLTLLGGAVLWTVMFVTTFTTMNFWVRRKFAQWLDRRWVLLPRKVYERLLAQISRLHEHATRLQAELAAARAERPEPRIPEPPRKEQRPVPHQDPLDHAERVIRGIKDLVPKDYR